MKTCDHEWIVFATAMMPPAIMVGCAKCFAIGGVMDHTDEEWNLAFFAPSMPFRWAAAGRVILQDDLLEPTPGDRQLVQDFLNHVSAGDFTTSSHTDDDFDEAGAMGWLETADQPQVQLTLRRGNADEFDGMDDGAMPAVADLVNTLDLFEGDDDDMPF